MRPIFDFSYYRLFLLNFQFLSILFAMRVSVGSRAIDFSP